MSEYKTPYGVPPFDKITNADYLPAFKAGIKQQQEEIAAIVKNSEAPTFENTILAMENSGEILDKVSNVFFNITESNSTDEIQAIADSVSPLLSKNNDDIYLNSDLYKRVKTIYDSMQNLLPVVAVDQHINGLNSRSTIGTITGIYDQLRLLYARVGYRDIARLHNLKPDRSLFSFNTAKGACPQCKGLGVEDYIDHHSLVGDSTKTLRQGALVLTTPKPYIIYSQVTMDVLDQVCHAQEPVFIVLHSTLCPITKNNAKVATEQALPSRHYNSVGKN